VCPAGRPPAAANASKCGDAASGRYSTTLYAVLGAILGVGLLATAGALVVLRRRRSTTSGQSCAGDKAEVILSDIETRMMGLPVKTGGFALSHQPSSIALTYPS
jgi:hypothetical protein